MALTLSPCKELKEFGFDIAKLILLLWLLQPLSLLPGPAAVLEGGLGEQRGWRPRHSCPSQLPGQHGEQGICQWQQDFSCHLLLS